VHDRGGARPCRADRRRLLRTRAASARWGSCGCASIRRTRRQPKPAFISLSRSRSQRAKSWELRAATSVARLWGEPGRRAEARDLLAPVYGWFTEGFDTRPCCMDRPVDGVIPCPRGLIRCGRSWGVPAPAYGSGRRQQL
jgi:hypothetical protein